jgi:hypothetical protein
LGVRKCGSTLLNQLCAALAAANDIKFVDVGSSMFDNNIAVREWNSDKAMGAIVYPGNVYGGFRDKPIGLSDHPRFVDGRKLLMVRDPRDALVSEYFSNAYSHPIPQANIEGDSVTRLMESQRASALRTTIDEYVLQRGSQLAGSMMRYEDILALGSTKTVRYEDYIFKKSDLLSVISAHFGWRIDDQLIGLILEWADQRPTKEDPRNFVRKVTPGDHREKLKPGTITKLNALVRPAMELFGYADN